MYCRKILDNINHFLLGIAIVVFIQSNPKWANPMYSVNPWKFWPAESRAKVDLWDGLMQKHAPHACLGR